MMNISDFAIEKFNELKKGNSFLRLSLKPGGWAGPQKVAYLDDKKYDNDKEFLVNNIPVVISENYVPVFENSNIDYYSKWWFKSFVVDR